MILVAIPSVIAVEWPENQEAYQGYAGAAMGVGLVLGPVVASGLLQFFDYFWTLIIFAVLLSLFGLLSAYFIPKRIDE